MTELIVFLSGAIIMVLEIVNTRILAPYFGTSTVVWTNVIGIVLFSLSIGYYLGGRLADRKKSISILALILILSALFTVLVSALNDLVSRTIILHIDDVRIASFLSSAILFVPLNICLGMISPYVIRLRIKQVSSSGGTVGNFFALSTIGSIVGTFIATYVLLPSLGSQNIYLICGAVLAVLSFLLGMRFLLKIRLLLLGCVIAASLVSLVQMKSWRKKIVDIDTQYNRVLIYDSLFLGKPARLMTAGRFSASAIFLEDSSFAPPYYRYFDYAQQPDNTINRVLMIGGGGLTYATYFSGEHPQAVMDVVEIDPELTKLASQYFGFVPNPRIHIIHQDGRVFLNQTNNVYDLIIIDAFNDQAVPFQLTTLEAVRQLYEALSPNGAVALNFIASVDGAMADFTKKEYTTYRKVFPLVQIYANRNPQEKMNTQNLILIAKKNTNRFPIPNEVKVHAAPSILTDNFAPVEYFQLNYHR